MTFRKLSLIFLAALSFPSRSFLLLAQSTGSIRGTITDQTGSVIPNATSTLTEVNTHLSRSTQANGDGIFVFPDLPIGTYTLNVSAPGFSTGG